MRVVVTGATGNMGTSVIGTLVTEPAVDEIVGLARRLPDWNPPKTTFDDVDVRGGGLVDTLRGADVVVHLAWAFQPTHAPTVTWDVNVLGSIAVFEAARQAGVGSIVYASSVAAYSPGAGRRVDETWPTHSLPVAAYGREKSYVERYLDAFELRSPSTRVVRIRPAFVFRYETGSEQRRIFAGPLLPKALVRPGRLPVVPVPTGLSFQAVHADDLADAVRRVVLSDVRGAFNVASDPVIDAAALGDILEARTVPVPATAVRAVVGATWRLRLVPADDGLLKLFLSLPTLDCSRAEQELGWRAQVSGPDALRSVLYGMAEGAGAETAPLQPDD